MIVGGGIIGLQLDGALKRRDRILRLASVGQRPPPADERIGEIAIELNSFAEMLNGGRPLFLLARDFANDVLGTRVVRVDAQLVFKLLLSVLERRCGLRLR